MLVIKIGGSLTDLDPLLQDVAACKEPLVMVHGANKELNDLSERLGHPPRMVTSERGEVSRFTDATTMDHFLMAYAGKQNKRIVERLRALGISLPQPAAPAANYIPFVISGALIYISGQLPMDGGGR